MQGLLDVKQGLPDLRMRLVFPESYARGRAVSSVTEGSKVNRLRADGNGPIKRIDFSVVHPIVRRNQLAPKDCKGRYFRDFR